jgi:hypothetical protein
MGEAEVTIHPDATIYFAGSTLHCFAKGESPHDPVSMAAETKSVVLTCEEPFPDAAQILCITITDGDT